MLPDFNQTEFAVFALILLRVTILVFLAPVFGSDIVPVQIKAAMSLVITLVLTPVVNIKAPQLPQDSLGYIPLILGEIFAGMTIALTIRLLLEGIQLAGQYIGYEMGFAIVNVIDPQTGAQSSVMSEITYILALIVFLALNGHYIIIKALVQSFDLIPMGQPGVNRLVFDQMGASMAGVFIIAVKIGAPTMAVLFTVKVSMGIVAKAVPQMNVLFVGMPLYIVVGMIVFGLSLSYFVPVLSKAIIGVDRSVMDLLKAM